MGLILRTKNGILDYREAKLEVTPDAISVIANYFLNASDASYGRADVITPRPLETALNVLFAKRRQRRNVLQVFTTWAAACEFIGVEEVPDPLEPAEGKG